MSAKRGWPGLLELAAAALIAGLAISGAPAQKSDAAKARKAKAAKSAFTPGTENVFAKISGELGQGCCEPSRMISPSQESQISTCGKTEVNVRRKWVALDATVRRPMGWAPPARWKRTCAIEKGGITCS